MSGARAAPTHFTSLPNEIVLIIWKYLTNVEAIRSFGSIGCQRYRRLLQAYCCTTIDFYAATLSTFQLCCTSMLDTFRLHVRVLKLGHQTSYCQLRLFSRYCLATSTLLDVFPQLQTLLLHNVHESDADDLAPYLSSMPAIEKLTLVNCPLSKATTLICEHLLSISTPNRLTSCTLHSTDQKDGLFLSKPISSIYQPQYSLSYLRIDVRDLASLKYLLMCLPGLSTLEVHLATDVKQSDQELFPASFCLCPRLTKLVLRSRTTVVLDFTSVVRFILLFQHTLVTLHMAIMQQVPNVTQAFTHVDGDRLFDEMVVHMRTMKEFSFLIETVCLCDQQMDNIIRSFQTAYWSTMRIGCHYDTTSCTYVIFTLPYLLDLRFVVEHDTMHTRFNYTGDRLDCLVPMIFDRAPGINLLISKNESLGGAFLDMLKQCSGRNKRMQVKPCGDYQLGDSTGKLTAFNQLEIIRRYENQPSDGLIHTTLTWLNWMPHIRLLNIDHELLRHLAASDINIERFSSLETLIVRQTKNSAAVEPLTVLTHLGVSSSLRAIRLQEYRPDSQLAWDHCFSVVQQICNHMRGLKVMTINFSSDASFTSDTLGKPHAVPMKNSSLEYIHVSNAYVELCFAE